jgi:hypothetical protein
MEWNSEYPVMAFGDLNKKKSSCPKSKAVFNKTKVTQFITLPCVA